MSLSDILTTKIQKDDGADDQGSWRQFVCDHLDYIAVRSRTYNIKPEVMELYKYDLPRFLKDRMSLHWDIGWIVVLLNDLGSELGFSDYGNYVIPSDTLISNLYHSYKTIAANATS